MIARSAMIVALCAAGCGSVHDGDSVDGGGSGSDAASGGGGSSNTMVAPYYYSYGWGSNSYAFSSLVDMKAKGGPSAVTIGFVLSNGGCAATADIQGHLDDLHAYIAAGGHVRASFGGALGTYLEYQCTTADALAQAIEKFIDDTGITDLDFDLEQHGQSSTPALNTLRATALKQVQTAKRAAISFTLPITTTGLLSESVDILNAAVAAGVEISYVNAMTMDFGAGTNLATAPQAAVDALVAQLRVLMPNQSVDQLYRQIGMTPMIGTNDDGTVLSADNASSIVAYIKQKHIGLLSYWAVQRDQACPSMADLGVCSQHNTKTFEYNAIFQGLK